MRFTLLIQSSPHSHQSAATALRFCREVLRQGHQVHRVFFYGDAVLTASHFNAPAVDELQLLQEWQALQQAHDLDLVVCIAAAVRRGVLNAHEAKRYEKTGHNLAEGFELSGLGQLAEAIACSDRVVRFGGSHG
ncbi:sulfurtransferase complex subunit TusD [Pontibacter sp. JAM-7]|uniref:sulfurtransferase complex subunit TusD n=1 Tax=Pontibacter sp. JAM-7 TaxID=3366581 RepID=UPI003AF7E44C